MSLVIIKEPKEQNVQAVGEFEPGTWFLDLDGQISVVLIDERTYEKRVLVIGATCRPYIASRAPWHFRASKVLSSGTILQIVQPGNYEERPNAE